MYRNTYVKICGETLTENARKIIETYPSYRYYIGVVKAGAYGHGEYVIKDLIRGGINYLAVSSLEEALACRRYEKEIPILVMEPVSLEHTEVFIQNGITMTVDSPDTCHALCRLSLSAPLKVHLKLDCGMNRLGVKDKKEAEECVKLLSEQDGIELEGIFTHIATSGVSDPYYDRSIQTFLELTQGIDLAQIPLVHINRSITLVHHTPLPFETGVRLGIVLYGLAQSIPEPKGLRKWKREWMLKRSGISRAILSNDLTLKTAFSLYSRVISIRTVQKGEAVGYGATYIASEPMRIATLPIGYHDGVEKGLGSVMIHDKEFAIVGEVCMDMISVKVDESVSVGDEAELFGDRISIAQAARRSGKNAYRLFTGITHRVPRLYSDGTEIQY